MADKIVVLFLAMSYVLIQSHGMKDDDMEADDIHRQAGDGPRVTRRAHRHKSSVEHGSDGHAGRTEESDCSPSGSNYIPVDFEEVRYQLQAGKYSSIVRTTLLMLDLVAVL